MVIETQSPLSQNSQNLQNIKDINSPHHPLFFHPNDHPGLLLISKKLLGSENYGTWRRSLLIALSAKNKLKLISGEYEETYPNSEFRAYWKRANDMLISWILNTVSEQICNNLTFINSAYALWNELYEHYSQLDGHRIYQLANEIVDLKRSNCTIEVYYHKLKGLWDEMDAIEAPYVCTCKRVYEKGKENGEREQRKSQLLRNTTKSVTFTVDKFIFQDYDGYNTHGILHGGLNILPTVSLPSKPHQSTIQSHSSSPHLSHAKLGHTSLPVIQKIKDIPLVVFSNSVNKCHVCPLAKQHVLPFPVSNAHAKSKFELVYFGV
nr:cysteine-rich RLK (receptor-like protein kinase) 8 [Tanacetum cinerariifolium]